MSTTDNQRLRPHPDDRFSQPFRCVDIQTVATTLRSESNAGERGHRQETVFKQGHLTVALFVFDRFSHLPEHVAEGSCFDARIDGMDENHRGWRRAGT